MYYTCIVKVKAKIKMTLLVQKLSFYYLSLWPQGYFEYTLVIKVLELWKLFFLFAYEEFYLSNFLDKNDLCKIPHKQRYNYN